MTIDKFTLGITVVTFSFIYFLSDVIEAAQGGFSTGQLWLTLVAEAAIPIFVVGLYLVQRPQIGRLGLISAAAYSYAYIYFTYTVVYALQNGISDYADLTDRLGVAMIIHGVIMVLAGLGFGLASIRAGVLPKWSGVALMAGVVAVGLTQSAPEIVQLVAAGLRDAGFAGMGISLITSSVGREALEPR